MNWNIRENHYNKEEITKNGNKYLIGNGYFGIRGSLQEYDKFNYPAINLSGIYDQYKDGWREPLNAPNGLYTYIEVDGVSYKLPDIEPKEHFQQLNIRHGIFTRTTTWNTWMGNITIHAEQFASLPLKHLIGLKYSVSLDFNGDLKIVTGIDGDVWDIHGPHYKDINLTVDDAFIEALCITNEGDMVSVCEDISKDFLGEELVTQEENKVLRTFNIKAVKDFTYTFYKYISVYTNHDYENPSQMAHELIAEKKILGYGRLLQESKTAWERLWERSEVVIEGDNDAMTSLNYSIYHLHSIAPRHTDSLSIPARGLSGQTYKGAIFWDTEMFMLDFFLYTEPQVVKTLLQYRIDTLDGALKKAKDYGYQGAFYAWESQEGGYDACTDYNVTDVFTKRPVRTYFKDKQVHISSAIVYGIIKYVQYTNDVSLYLKGGATVIIECARFYLDLLVKKVIAKQYEIHDVIGPDEYHERINNNAYTNRMAKFTFESGLQVIEKLKELDVNLVTELDSEYNLDQLVFQLKDAIENIYMKQPDDKNRVIEQFDGYFNLEEISMEDLKKRILDEREYLGGANGIASHTKIIKQADVVTMLNLFSKEYTKEVKQKNLDYYEPFTEHGSSLSACMYAILACECNEPEKAYPFFVKTANADLVGGGKEWAGLVYIGGTHPAAAGGAYKTAIEGFGGFKIIDGKIVIEPHLPKNWAKLAFTIFYNEKWNRVEIEGDQVSIQEI